MYTQLQLSVYTNLIVHKHVFLHLKCLDSMKLMMFIEKS